MPFGMSELPVTAFSAEVYRHDNTLRNIRECSNEYEIGTLRSEAMRRSGTIAYSRNRSSTTLLAVSNAALAAAKSTSIALSCVGPWTRGLGLDSLFSGI